VVISVPLFSGGGAGTQGDGSSAPLIGVTKTTQQNRPLVSLVSRISAGNCSVRHEVLGEFGKMEGSLLNGKLLIKNGRLVDPANQIDEQLDILIQDGKIAGIANSIANNPDTAGAQVIDATGRIVAPGLIDMHCHLRIPGFPEREDLTTGSRAAAAGGFTTVVPHPNTRPVIDNLIALRNLQEQIAKESIINILPAASITLGQKGNELSPLTGLAAFGVPLFSEDGQTLASAALMRRALQAAKQMDIPICHHNQDKSLAADGAMYAGEVAARLGIPGIPASSETVMAARDIVLARETGGHIHICHVCYAPTVELIRLAKQCSVSITAEATVHHFTLTDAAVAERGAYAKINPPLGTQADIDAIKKGLQDGTIDAIVTDHAPWTAAEKDRDIKTAPFGLIGFETALSLVISELVNPGVLTLSEAIAKMTVNPNRILKGVSKGRLNVGADADLIIIDQKKQWVADPDRYQSKSRNCPYRGRRMQGKVEYTIVGGRIVVAPNI